MATVNVGGVSYTSNSSTPYIDAYNSYKENLAKSRDEYRNTVNDQLAKDVGTTNTQYDNAARQNYVQYMQNKKSLAGQLNSVGVNGGASESAMLRLGTSYGNNVASNEANRGTAITSLNQNASSNLANYDNAFNEKLADAYATAHENQLKYTRELQEKDLQNYAASINGRFNTVAEYNAEIARLRKLGVAGDANANEKVALAQQAMAALKQRTASAYGGGGGYSSYSSGGSSSSGSSSASANNAVNVAKATAGALSKNTSSKKPSLVKPWRIWGL